MKVFMKLVVALTAILVLSALPGCRKRYINGDLDGLWQVLTIEYVADGHVENVKAKQIYYAFNLHTVQLMNRTSSITDVLGNMKYDKSTLSLEFPLVDDASSLAAWGMNSSSTVFRVRQLTGDKLVIESDYAVITCRKF